MPAASTAPPAAPPPTPVDASPPHPTAADATRVHAAVALAASAATREGSVLESSACGGRVRVLSLIRPSARNAVGGALGRALCGALAAADADARVHAVVLTGCGAAGRGVFCAGADVREMARLGGGAGAARARWLDDWKAAFAACRTVVIAAVDGAALGGGCELAMMCDMVYCCEGARFALPELRLGTIPGAGGTQRLVRAVGKARAMEVVLAGRPLGADEACAAGLVARVFGGGELLERVLEVAGEVAAHGGDTLALAKQALNMAENAPLDQGVAFERGLYYMSFGGRDFAEGTSAFTEKRAPQFE